MVELDDEESSDGAQASHFATKASNLKADDGNSGAATLEWASLAPPLDRCASGPRAG